LQAVDDVDEVELDGLVDLHEPLLAAVPGVGEQLAGPVELFAVQRQELVAGEEVIAGRARVRVRTGLLKGQPQ
jgi:hypothetical protein